MSDWSDGLDLGAIFGGDSTVGFDPFTPTPLPADSPISITNPDGSVSQYDANGNWIGGAPPSWGNNQGSPTDTQGDTTTGGDASRNPLNIPSLPSAGAGGASTGSGWTKALQSLGMLTPSGDPNALGLAAVLGPLLGGLLGYTRTGTAANQVVGGINNASQAAKQLLGGPSPFAPFATIGNQALGKLGSFTWNPITMAPLGTVMPPSAPQPNATLASLMTRSKGRK